VQLEECVKMEKEPRREKPDTGKKKGPKRQRYDGVVDTESDAAEKVPGNRGSLSDETSNTGNVSEGHMNEDDTMDEAKMKELSEKLGLPLEFKKKEPQGPAHIFTGRTGERLARQYLNRPGGLDAMLPAERTGETTKFYKAKKRFRPTPKIL